MKLHYKVSISGFTCLDDCKFRNDGTKVGSLSCENCEHHIKTNEKGQFVECNAGSRIVRRKQIRDAIIMAILGAGVAALALYLMFYV